METEQSFTPLTTFEFEGVSQQVEFVETLDVTEGVKCDVYRFVGDKTKDLGIIKVEPGFKTPLQRVLKGDRTVEGYVSGKGRFTLSRPDESQEVHPVGGESQEAFSVTVNIGEFMQWEADKDSALVAYEVCFPPYEDGRFENIEQQP